MTRIQRRRRAHVVDEEPDPRGDDDPEAPNPATTPEPERALSRGGGI